MYQNVCPKIPTSNSTQNAHLYPCIKLVQIITKERKVPITAPELCIIAKAFVVAMYFASSVCSCSLVNAILRMGAYFPNTETIRLKTDTKNWRPPSIDKIIHATFNIFSLSIYLLCPTSNCHWCGEISSIECTGFLPILLNLTDPVVSVEIESVHLFKLLDKGTQCILRQLKLVFKRLDSILNWIGFSLLTIHQAGLYDFPENAHFSPQVIFVVSNQ